MKFSSIGWSSFGTERQHPTYKWMELARSADFLCRKVLGIQPDENIVICADTASDPRVVEATAAAIYTIGAHPAVIVYETRSEPNFPPPKPVKAAILAADMVIDFAVAYLVHSGIYAETRQAGVPMKCLTGMNVDMMIRCLDPDNHEKIQEFGRAYDEILINAQSFRVTSPAGTDIKFKVPTLSPEELAAARARASARGGMLGGQGLLYPIRESVNGTVVFDGAIWPPSEIGAIRTPIKLEVGDGVVKQISGGVEAEILKNWFAHFNDERAYNTDHISPGYHPGVKRITGDIVEDERVFGDVEMGIGHSEIPCHTDGIILRPSIWVDGVLIEDEGIFVELTLKELAKELGMQLWA